MPSPTQNAFMDRMRQMMFRPIRNRAPEPARPDYNEQPSADESVQIPVGPDYSPFLFQNVDMAEIETSGITRPWPESQSTPELRSALSRMTPEEIRSRRIYNAQTNTINWGEVARSMSQNRLAADESFAAWRYAQQAPQPSERTLTRERLRYAAERLRSGVVSTPWHEAPEWLSHRKNELVELPYIMEYGSVVEHLLRWDGDEYVVLPTISLKTGRVEYKKGSPEPQNGKERTECEEFAMKEIRKWAAENKTLAAMA